jgi:hypothetical protein
VSLEGVGGGACMRHTGRGLPVDDVKGGARFQRPSTL